ncbi:CD59 antigen domain-containing protein [Strongyloides ratti]|uniref:CD59 antigen domain-containing protein n=1 Tax=Strongyloides ratti TaxID=34506 RepID=A0A090MYS9_STRRB|nr:CD59 antigen domain-containing protein [Strongyloides ratti]CEF67714.1 CD59 antigen domain-containing protein [Strongyloides ratti]
MFSKLLCFLIIIYFLVVVEEIYCKNVLKCYYCGIRKKGTQNWISFNNETCKSKVVACTKNHVACVKARVFDHTTQFIITGCSEDKFTGCDQSELTPGGAKLERCQCKSNLCNDLEKFKLNTFKFVNDNKVEKNNDKLESHEEGAFIVTEQSFNKYDKSIINKYKEKDNSQHLNKKTPHQEVRGTSDVYIFRFL